MITLGAHVGIGKGLQAAVKTAEDFGMTTLQLFSGNPYSFSPKPIDIAAAKQWQTDLQKIGITRTTVHANYINNLASVVPKTFHTSLTMLKKDVERSALLGATYFNFHLGSTKDQPLQLALAQAKKGFGELVVANNTDVIILIENSAGGKKVGNTIEEIAEVLSVVKKKDKKKVGVTWDTCHGFDYGVDWRDAKITKKFFDDFDKKIGLEFLRVLHLNDSLHGLGSKRDRHANWGKGEMGKKGLEIFLTEVQKRNLDVDLILETDPEGHKQDLTIIRSLLH